MLPIISASRRTDLPRFHPEKLAKWIHQGYAPVKNPYNGIIRNVQITPDKIHTLVLWSKDFTPILENQYDLLSEIKRFKQLYIHFTVTGMGGTNIEPGILPYQEAVKQFSQLIELVQDERRIRWRFDPIVFWKDRDTMVSNQNSFFTIAKSAKNAGIQHVTLSICYWYSKAIRRSLRYAIKYYIPNKEEIVKSLNIILEISNTIGIDVDICCCDDDIPNGISKSKCIDGEKLSQLHPTSEKASTAKDSGQRSNCNCSKSIDIGSYDLHCNGKCVYCYANPKL